MISMTGFAYRDWAGENISLSIEIKGYNNRYLEIYVNTPSWLSRLEPRVRDIAAGICGRGKVEISIRVKDTNAPLAVSVNTNAARAYIEAVSGLAAELATNQQPHPEGMGYVASPEELHSGFNTFFKRSKERGIKPLSTNNQLSIPELIGMEGVLDIEKGRDDERYWAFIEPVLRETAGAFQAERIREGAHTEEDILNSIGNIESALQTVAAHIPTLENSIKENIKTRFRELTDSAIDENRILAETAVLLMKHTVSEEISRLSSHLAEFRAEAAKNSRPGKKLDFLCQEINREINTIGSKSTILEISRSVVTMKEALENVREQLRNVE